MYLIFRFGIQFRGIFWNACCSLFNFITKTIEFKALDSSNFKTLKEWKFTSLEKKIFSIYKFECSFINIQYIWTGKFHSVKMEPLSCQLNGALGQLTA